MIDFKVEQKKVKIGNVEIGGIPGEQPTVLIGTIFYRKHKIVFNEETGDFDYKKAEQLINTQETLSDITKNPCMIDVVGSSLPIMMKNLDFITDITEAPLLLDAPTFDIMIESLKYVKEIGLLDRIIYNSIHPFYNQKEIDKIKEVGLKNAIFLTLNHKDFTSAGRLKSILKAQDRLLEAGINNLLVDTCVFDLPSFGSACRAIIEVKNKLGLPTGIGAHNAISTWKGLKKKFGRYAVKPCISACMASAATVGADFILYGPIEDAKYVFPAVAMIDTALSQLAIEKGKKVSPTHPRYNIA